MAKVVKFNDGSFGVRRFSFFFLGYVYQDLRAPKYWWPPYDFLFVYCKGTIDEALKAYAYRNGRDKGKPVIGVHKK